MDGNESQREGDRSFVGSIPEIYDRLMVPLIFAEPAASMAARVAERSPTHILETAAGTGVLTAALVAACPEAEVLATDLNQPMLDRASARFNGASVVLQQADALHLPVEDASFDVVVCQFGVMFFPDRAAAHREAKRVLRPGGTWLFSTWDSLQTNDFARVVTHAVQGLAGDGSLDFMDRVPHGYHQEERIREDLAHAGFDEVGIEPVESQSISTAEDAALALCQGTPLRGILEAHPHVNLHEATQVAVTALRSEYGDGEIRGLIRWLEVTAER